MLLPATEVAIVFWSICCGQVAGGSSYNTKYENKQKYIEALRDCGVICAELNKRLLDWVGRVVHQTHHTWRCHCRLCCHWRCHWRLCCHWCLGPGTLGWNTLRRRTACSLHTKWLTAGLISLVSLLRECQQSTSNLATAKTEAAAVLYTNGPHKNAHLTSSSLGDRLHAIIASHSV